MRFFFLLGPAFIAATAYVDPGNVAANLTAGAQYGYLLVWVLVVANIMAVLVQYQSAKLGLVTGKGLPEILGQNLGNKNRRLFCLQAEIIAAATDIAEIIGGAVALNLLFDVPLLIGAIIVTLASMCLLSLQKRQKQQRFELVIIFLLLIICVGFLYGLLMHPPDSQKVLSGLIPKFAGQETVLLATGMLGATVMPHVIYLHSTLTRDRYLLPKTSIKDVANGKQLLRATRWDVIFALFVAGTVNIAMLLLAAGNLQGVVGTETLEGAYAAIYANLGEIVAKVFAVGLLASSLASTAVGGYAGSAIIAGLLHVKIPVLLRRVLVALPALFLLSINFDPTRALILSQVVLSMGIPFALIPLLRYSANRKLMGEYVDGFWLKISSRISVTLIIVLNILLIFLTIFSE